MPHIAHNHEERRDSSSEEYSEKYVDRDRYATRSLRKTSDRGNQDEHSTST